MVGVVFAQNQTQKFSLAEILTSIEKQYDVKFSYSSNLIKNVLCFPFKNEKTLKEKLESAGFSVKVTKHYVTITYEGSKWFIGFLYATNTNKL